MIVVPIVLSSAITKMSKALGTIVITNDGTGTLKKSNYDYKIIGKSRRVLRTGKIKDYRRQARPVFDLVLEVLNDAGYRSRV